MCMKIISLTSKDLATIKYLVVVDQQYSYNIIIIPLLVCIKMYIYLRLFKIKNMICFSHRRIGRCAYFKVDMGCKVRDIYEFLEVFL